MSSIFNDFFEKRQNNKKTGEIKYKNEQPINQDVIKIKAKVEGYVQGVGFRYTTVHVAKKIGIDGIVENKNDGSVYVEAVGNKEEIEQFILELAKGPSPSATVDKVTIEYDDSVKNYRGFGQRH